MHSILWSNPVAAVVERRRSPQDRVSHRSAIAPRVSPFAGVRSTNPSHQARRSVCGRQDVSALGDGAEVSKHLRASGGRLALAVHRREVGLISSQSATLGPFSGTLLPTARRSPSGFSPVHLHVLMVTAGSCDLAPMEVPETSHVVHSVSGERGIGATADRVGEFKVRRSCSRSTSVTSTTR